jgi:hypothetical protein
MTRKSYGPVLAIAGLFALFPRFTALVINIIVLLCLPSSLQRSIGIALACIAGIVVCVKIRSVSKALRLQAGAAVQHSEGRAACAIWK